MVYVIIPCYNESPYIEKIINEASKSSADRILVVDNGSVDGSLDIIRNNPSEKLDLLYFNVPLGHDVPRAAGLYYALLDGGDHFVFLDGDMTGINRNDINHIIKSLKMGVDLSLTDCYYNSNLPSGLAHHVLEFRKQLNIELGLFDKIRYSTPSHGPHGLSKNLALSVPLQYVAVPPLLLCHAAKMGYTVEIGLNKLHKNIGSYDRSKNHALKMAETIIGDCVSGINYVRSRVLSRRYKGVEYIGYHRDRRFEMLELIVKNTAH